MMNYVQRSFYKKESSFIYTRKTLSMGTLGKNNNNKIIIKRKQKTPCSNQAHYKTKCCHSSFRYSDKFLHIHRHTEVGHSIFKMDLNNNRMYYSINMYGKHLRTVDIWNNKEKHSESTFGAKVWHSTSCLTIIFFDILEKAEHPSHFWYTRCLSHFCETVWCYLICCFYLLCFFLSIYVFTYFFLSFFFFYKGLIGGMFYIVFLQCETWKT